MSRHDACQQATLQAESCASPMGRTNEFAFPAGGMTYRLASKATPTAVDRCRAALDLGELHALQLLV